MATAGYSGTPLAKKLGIKEGYIIQLINAPSYYFSLFTDWPEKIEMGADHAQKKNLVHLFAKQAKDLEHLLPQLRKEIKPDGMIWVSWPKKSSKMPTDITEDVIRRMALSNGLVDVKVCAVDDTWSGIKLVIPLNQR